ncbi:MAG TPA: hypothetical protein VK459_23975, partial [Polyangiaceae bacterium]|nr:hypothetical protein [Polyangiaceae bacterium]
MSRPLSIAARSAIGLAFPAFTTLAALAAFAQGAPGKVDEPAPSLLAVASARPPLPAPGSLRGGGAWAERSIGGIRGVTIGPIESLRHAGRGYGTDASARAMDEAVRMGATWVSLTPFGRVWDLDSTEIDLVFEAPFDENRRNMLAAMRQAHERGLKVMLVPHMWVETGGWRALMSPAGGTDEGWRTWAASYRSFALTWAEVAREGGAEMFSVGVELRSWVTTPRAESFSAIIRDVREVYSGLITYSANWDDVDDTLILDDLDLIGINAFYPLAEREGAPFSELLEGGRRVAAKVDKLAREMEKPVVLTEIGYTTRVDPAVKPWEWPDSMKDVKISERAQAEAYAALLAPFLDTPSCAGFFVWRLYADPADVSQE